MSTTATASEQGNGDAEQEERPFVLDLNKVRFSEYKGVMLPHYRDSLEIHVHKLMNLSLRDTDIILLTYPKSGTHWLWRTLDMLATGSAAYSDRVTDTFYLDLVPAEVIDKTSMDVRRVLDTHYPADLLPTQIKDGRVKVVHVYRHPKAVMVSMFHMRKKGKHPDLTLDKLEETMYAEKAVCKNQFYYFDKLKEFERDNPNVDIFHLAYEDMKKDTVGCIRKLAAYLNVDASEELCFNIAEAVSFSTQKKQEEALGDEEQTTLGMYRKGEVDDWKNYLTVAQSERMDKVLADRAASCQFCRRYCPTVTTDQGHVYRLAPSSY